MNVPPKGSARESSRDAGSEINPDGADQGSVRNATEWLVWSNEHRMWWAANRCGYRTKPEEAGRYTLEEAISICRVRGWENGVPPEVMLHESAIRALPVLEAAKD